MKNWMRFEELAIGSPVKVGMPTFSYQKPDGLVKTVVCNYQTGYEPLWIRVPYDSTVDKIHLLEKLDNAMALSAVNFPENLFTKTPLQGAWTARTSNAPVNTVKPFLRFCGWVQALKPNAFLRPSGRGAGSPYEPNWWKIAQRHPSPGAIVPWVKSAWRVAERLLAPCGLKPIRHDRVFGQSETIAAMLLADAPRNPRRAGFCWAALTLVALSGQDLYGVEWHTYRGARKILTGFAQAKKTFPGYLKARAIVAVNGFGDADFTWRVVDDVAGWYTEAGDKKWIKKSFYITVEDYETGWLYEGLGRTYHAHGPDAWRWAVREWKHQRDLEKTSAETIALVTEKLANNQETPMTVIVTYADSRKAGNCHDGTVAWTRKVFGDRFRFAAPLKEVFRYADEQRVLNVLTEII